MLQEGRTDPDPSAPKGLLTKIIHVLMQERADSIYRFWLASCVESYLRGSCPEEQVFVAKTGLLRHLVGEILSDVGRVSATGCSLSLSLSLSLTILFGHTNNVHCYALLAPQGLKCAGSLQTAFDLLGELSKCNLQVLRMLESSLDDAEFRRLMEVRTLCRAFRTLLSMSYSFSRDFVLSFSGGRDQLGGLKRVHPVDHLKPE